MVTRNNEALKFSSQNQNFYDYYYYPCLMRDYARVINFCIIIIIIIIIINE